MSDFFIVRWCFTKAQTINKTQTQDKRKNSVNKQNIFAIVDLELKEEKKLWVTAKTSLVQSFLVVLRTINICC